MIRRDLKNMKKRRAAICFLMVFIMSFTLLPIRGFCSAKRQLKSQTAACRAEQKVRRRQRKAGRRNEGKRDVCKGCV